MATGSQDFTNSGGAVGGPVPAPAPYAQGGNAYQAEGYGWSPNAGIQTGGTPPAADPAYGQLGLTQGMSASDTYAALTQQMWQQYESTFVPIENQLISYATDPTQASKAMAQAKTDVTQAYGAQQGAMARALQGEGITLNPQQQAAQARQQNLSQSLATVQGQNVAHDLTVQNQQSILGNPAPSVSQVAQAAANLGS
jgi:hypothetical protein